MPHVTISLYPGRSLEEKTKLSNKVRDDIVEILHVDKDAVSISTREVRDGDWKQAVYDKEICADDVELHVKPGYSLK